MHKQNAIDTKLSDWSKSLGLALIVVGIGTMAAPAVLAPFHARAFSTLIIGYVLVFAGIEQAAFAMRRRESGRIPFRVLLAVLYSTAGIALVRMPSKGVFAALPITGGLFILDGIVEVVNTVLLHGQSKEDAWLSTSGILSLSSGTFVFASGIIFLFLRSFPRSGSVWIISLCVGLRLVFKGIEQMLERPVSITSGSNRKGNGLTRAA